MFVWTITLIVSIVVGLWLGSLLLALRYPINGYGEILSAVSILFTAIVTFAGILFGLEKYKKDQLFKLGIQSSFSEELFKKQREFYEAYLDKIGEIERWIYINGQPEQHSKNDFYVLVSNLIVLRRGYEKWLSKKQLQNINTIEDKHLKLNASAGLAIAYQNELTEGMQEKRLNALNKVFDSVTDLLSDQGYAKFRNDLKEVFLVNDIVRMQEHVISKSKEGI